MGGAAKTFLCNHAGHAAPPFFLVDGLGHGCHDTHQDAVQFINQPFTRWWANLAVQSIRRLPASTLSKAREAISPMSTHSCRASRAPFTDGGRPIAKCTSRDGSAFPVHLHGLLWGQADSDTQPDSAPQQTTHRRT